MKIYTYNICKYSFFDTAVADILRAIDGNSLMGSFVLGFCCIDYMGMALKPSNPKNTGSEFKEYVKKYLGAVNEVYCERYEELWIVRNSLIHVYGESDASKKSNLAFHFGHQYPENHLKLLNNTQKEIWFNLPNFIGELVASIEYFFRSNKQNEDQLKEWYRKLLTIQGAPGYLDMLIGTSDEQIRHSNSHKFFNILDSKPKPNIEIIANTISERLNKQLNNST